MLALIFTILVFILLILGMRKKIELKTLLLGETILILIILTFVKGSVAGDAATGSLVFDILSFITGFLSGNIGGVVLSMIIVSAYVEVMNHIQATNKLADLISIPVSHIKNKYIILALVMIITGLLRTCITSGPACVLLMLATLYPVMRRSGCTVAESCVAILLSNSLCWGPADPIDMAAAGLMGIEVNSAEWFVSNQLLIFAIYFGFMILVYVLLTARSAGGQNSTADAETGTKAQLKDVPLIYALLPVLPLIIMLIFSPFFVTTVHIDINIACFAALLISLIVVIAFSRKAGMIPDLVRKFFDSFGDVLKTLGMPVLLAMVFASAMNAVGGMKIISEAITNLSMPPVFLVLLLCVFAFIINVVVGSFIGALSIAEPLAATISAAAGLNQPLICFLVIMACGAGCVCSPVNPMVMILSEKVPTMELIRRTAPAALIGMIAAAVIGFMAMG